MRRESDVLHDLQGPSPSMLDMSTRVAENLRFKRDVHGCIWARMPAGMIEDVYSYDGRGGSQPKVLFEPCIHGFAMFYFWDFGVYTRGQG
jgi:hypothetical protein